MLHALGFRRLRATGLKQKHVNALVAEWQRRGLADRDGQEPHVGASLVGRAGRAPGRGRHQRGARDRGAALHHQPRSRALAPRSGQARAGERCARADVARAPGGVRAAARGGDQVHARLRGPRRSGADQGVVGEGRTGAGDPDLERGPARGARRGPAPRGRPVRSSRAGATTLAHRKVYERQTDAAGLSRMHGLRHAFAQERYEALTGWKAPAVGGPRRRSLGPARRRIDTAARMKIARELGHGRREIASVYLGA